VRRRPSLVVQGTKAHGNDLVSDVDLASERLITDALSAAWPADGILGEEGHDTAGTSGRRWVVDPLDGTRNYVTASGPWSVSIALFDGDQAVAAVVHDPASGETFTAVAGGGARLGGEPIAVSGAALAEAVVGLSFNPSPATKQQVAALIGRMLPVIGDLRRLPAALDLAYLAAGRLDAAVLVDTKPWDVAAGLLIATEAGAHHGSRAPERLLLAGTSDLAGALVTML
jgi:myo-inositol-1(or 4)-monophosphatase